VDEIPDVTVRQIAAIHDTKASVEALKSGG